MGGFRKKAEVTPERMALAKKAIRMIYQVWGLKLSDLQSKGMGNNFTAEYVAMRDAVAWYLYTHCCFTVENIAVLFGSDRKWPYSRVYVVEQQLRADKPHPHLTSFMRAMHGDAPKEYRYNLLENRTKNVAFELKAYKFLVRYRNEVLKIVNFKTKKVLLHHTIPDLTVAELMGIVEDVRLYSKNKVLKIQRGYMKKFMDQRVMTG